MRPFTRRRRAAAGGVLLAGAALLLALPGRAEAAGLAKAGWWWRVNDGSLPVTPPPPTNVPEGGLLVAGAPDGATAIAALHFDVADNETSPVLTLTVAPNGDQGGSTAVLAACVTGSAWDPASAGGWGYKPFSACDQGSVNGIRSDDGASWTFALAPLLSGGIVDVTLVPGVDASRPPGANGSTFQLAFNPPTAASLATTPGSATTADFPAPDFGAPDGGYDAGAYDPSAGGGFDLPAVPTESGFTPALPPADQGLTATAPVVQDRNAPLRATTAAAVAEHKGLAALVFVLCGGALLWSAQLPVPDPRRLGTFTGPGDVRRPSAAHVDRPGPSEVGGLGRFARARSGSAPRL